MKGFTWVKLNQNAELRINKALAEGEVTDFYDFLDLLNAETRMNGGNHTRANTEDLLIATAAPGWNESTPGLSRLSTARSARTAKSRGKCATGWSFFTAMCRALNCLAAARHRAGMLGNEVDGDVKLVPGRYENAE
jgi:hypothetical protein